MRPCDAVLLIAFGGPERMEDVRPFLENVLRGRPVPPERVDEVVHHYEVIGGRSPLNDLTFRQARALAEVLRNEGTALPVYVGMRNWNPYLRETVMAMAADGVRRAVGIILSPQQNDAGWGRYVRDVAEALRETEAKVEVETAPGWADHPLFVEAVADRVESALATLPERDRFEAKIVFTAHSIPVAMAANSPYVEQLRAAARAVCNRIGFGDYLLAYQSRSGNPREPWLGPDITGVVREQAQGGSRTLVVVPIGFVCDHVEVLYDLDVEAKAIADSLGVGWVRAGTVGDHPAFIRMLAEVIRKHVAQGTTRS